MEDTTATVPSPARMWARRALGSSQNNKVNKLDNKVFNFLSQSNKMLMTFLALDDIIRN
jgi:hypothetical protein